MKEANLNRLHTTVMIQIKWRPGETRKTVKNQQLSGFGGWEGRKGDREG